jgi:NAD(P)-dependent dehydrogenase (short-subunit alcohol dehydrogenase family)
MRLELDGRKVMVTGGAGALGQSVVAALLREGATALVPCLTERDETTIRGLGDPRAVAVPAGDLSDEGRVEALYGGLEDLWASIHLAGGFAAGPVAELRLADFRRQVDMNLTNCFLCCREAVRAFRRRGGGGRIVNVAARQALTPVGGSVAYSTTKAGVASLTQCLAEEVRPEGVLVNAIVPSVLDTPANRAAMPGADPSGWPRPADLAEVIAFLASPANRAATGTLVQAYGRA